MSSVDNKIVVPFVDINRTRQLASAAYLADKDLRTEVDRLTKLLVPGADLRPDLVVLEIVKLRQSADRKWRLKSSLFKEAQQKQGKKKGGSRHPKTAA